MDYSLRRSRYHHRELRSVLILILMDYSLSSVNVATCEQSLGLNPYSNGLLSESLDKTSRLLLKTS